MTATTTTTATATTTTTTTATAFLAFAMVCAACSSSANDLGASDAGPVPDGAPADAVAVDAPGDARVVDAANDAGADAPTVGCGAFAGDTSWTCASDGKARGRCEGDASLSLEACARGCLREPVGQDAVCMGTTDNWSCGGSYGTARAMDGDYYLTSFGCWVDASNVIHTDPTDNCIPSCFSKAQTSGLCAPSDTGPACEEKVNWYVADGARFGCLQRLRVTNPANGKAVIAVALDFGPACSVEATVSKAVLDASGRVNQYLFGGDQGVVDHALVHVVEVDDTTPLGPVP